MCPNFLKKGFLMTIWEKISLIADYASIFDLIGTIIKGIKKLYKLFEKKTRYIKPRARTNYSFNTKRIRNKPIYMIFGRMIMLKHNLYYFKPVLFIKIISLI